MKKIPILFLLACAVCGASAQLPQGAQKELQEAQEKLKELQNDPQVRAAMQKARQAMDSLRSSPAFHRQMAQSRHRVDSMKKANPANSALAGVTVPDMDNMKLPDLDSVSASIGQASGFLQRVSRSMSQALPKQDAFRHAERLPPLSRQDMTALARSLLQAALRRTGGMTRSVLEKMARDTSINVAATGAFVLASGGSKDAAAILICTGLLKDPADKWAANDLGVYCRDLGQYEKALGCYFYAHRLDSGRSKVIEVNIGWASAYYGDFRTAMSYFDKALALDGSYAEALEGEALLAYQQGDIGKLFGCLAGEISFIGMDGAAGPSDDFAAVCGGAYADHTINGQGQGANPNADHTFDHPPADQGSSQDPPPGADVDPVTYPNFRKVFISDARELMSAHLECIAQAKEAQKSINELVSEEKQTMQKRRPLYTAPYADGNKLVYPKSFARFIDLIDIVEMQFDRRLDWDNKALMKKMDDYRNQVMARDGDMITQYNNGMLKCAKLNGEAATACANELQCTWIPKMYHSKQNDLDVVSRAWDDYDSQVASTIQWFIDATGPLISRVHDQDWNSCLNIERELAVRGAILGSYGDWDYCLGSITTSVVFYIQQPAPACAPIQVAGVKPPDPFSRKPRHIQEFEGPCYDITTGAFGLGLSAEQTCRATTITLEAGPLKVFYTHVGDPVYAQNNGYVNKMGADISVSKDIDIIGVGEGENEKSLLSAGAGVEGKVSLNFDDNWQFTGGSSSVGASANLGSVNLGGIEATRTVEMVSGQLNVNPLSVTTTPPLH
jgi:tetratricopeptide (TPR) repeat protein